MIDSVACMAPSCHAQIAPRHLFCSEHWRRIPLCVRRELMRTSKLTPGGLRVPTGAGAVLALSLAHAAIRHRDRYPCAV